MATQKTAAQKKYERYSKSIDMRIKLLRQAAKSAETLRDLEYMHDKLGEIIGGRSSIFR